MTETLGMKCLQLFKVGGLNPEIFEKLESAASFKL